MLQIVQYPHPTLRHKSKPLKRVDKQIHRYIDEMFERMYEAKGIGLAANQVDLPFRFFVINPSGDYKKSDQQQVYINPVLTARKGSDEAEEGCLSLPSLYAQVRRPEKVTVEAYDISGKPIFGEIDGLLSRVVQHETDHLDGVLFIDRLSETEQLVIKESIREFEVNFLGARERQEIPEDSTIAEQLAKLQFEYC